MKRKDCCLHTRSDLDYRKQSASVNPSVPAYLNIRSLLYPYRVCTLNLPNPMYLLLLLLTP